MAGRAREPPPLLQDPTTPPSHPFQPDEGAGLVTLLGLTSASLGLLAADAGGAWAPAWDAGVHPWLPALRAVRAGAAEKEGGGG